MASNTSNRHEDSDEDNFDGMQPTSKLKNSINLSQLKKEGSVFEIMDSDVEKDDFSYQSPKYDGRNFQNLTLDDDHSDEEDDLEMFEKMRKKMTDISGCEKVFKRILKKGVGTRIPDGAHVVYHYSMFFEYADEPFDSSLSRKPVRASLSKGDMIMGVQIALKSMRNKERAHFLISPEFAFGKHGCPPRIPGDQTILADISLLEYYNFQAADVYDDMTEEQKRATTFEDKVKAAEAYQRKATDFFKKKHLHKARNHYYKALNVMSNSIVMDADQESKQMSIMFRMHANLAQVFLNLHQAASACSQCQYALDLPGRQPNDIMAKLFFRYSTAKLKLDHFVDARKFAGRAQKFNQNNEQISSLIKEINNVEKKFQQREVILYKRMFQTDPKPDPQPVLKADTGLDSNDVIVNQCSVFETDGHEIVINEAFDAGDNDQNCDNEGFLENLIDTEGMQTQKDTSQDEFDLPDDPVESTKQDKSFDEDCGIDESFGVKIREQIENFDLNDLRMQISLPPGLSKMNMRLAKKFAEDKGFLVETNEAGSRSRLIIKKMTDYEQHQKY